MAADSRERRADPSPGGYGRMVPFPITTDRLLIDYLAAVDVPAFVAYRQDPAVARLQGWEPTFDEDDARELVARQPAGPLPEAGTWAQLAVRDAGTGQLYGDLGLHVLEEQPATYELGCTMAPAAQGRGIAAEAVDGVLGHLFGEAGAHRVIAFCDARNDAVARLTARMGMRHESRQVDADHAKGEWTTVDGYAILAREWAVRSAERARVERAGRSGPN